MISVILVQMFWITWIQWFIKTPTILICKVCDMVPTYIYRHIYIHALFKSKFSLPSIHTETLSPMKVRLLKETLLEAKENCGFEKDSKLCFLLLWLPYDCNLQKQHYLIVQLLYTFFTICSVVQVVDSSGWHCSDAAVWWWLYHCIWDFWSVFLIPLW